MELNKLAVTMGKVMLILADIEPKISYEMDVYDHKEELCTVAYVCKKGILDRIERNPTLASNPMMSIRIPLGLFKSRKETIDSALHNTIGKLKQIVSSDIVTKGMVDNILNGGNLYYNYDEILPPHFKNNL